MIQADLQKDFTTAVCAFPWSRLLQSCLYPVHQFLGSLAVEPGPKISGRRARYLTTEGTC